MPIHILITIVSLPFALVWLGILRECVKDRITLTLMVLAGWVLIALENWIAWAVR